MLKIRAVAAILEVSPDTVRRWADRGLLPATKLPSGHRRFDPHDVHRFALGLRDGSPEQSRVAS